MVVHDMQIFYQPLVLLYSLSLPANMHFYFYIFDSDCNTLTTENKVILFRAIRVIIFLQYDLLSMHLFN